MEKDYSFNGQREGEKVLEVITRHPYVLYLPGLKTVVILSVVVAIFLFLPSFYLAAILVLIFALTYFFGAFYGYKETYLLITDQRLFYINQRGFFRRKISEVDLFKILDMTSETEGLAKTMLKYGSLIVRTAGASEGGDMVISDIPDPYSIQQRIAGMTGKEKS